MKKFLLLSIFLVLFATGIIVFYNERENKLVYEQRIVAVVDVIKKSLRSIATGDDLVIDVLAPKTDFQEAGGSLVVTGIVGLSSVGRRELFDRFFAVLRNDCGADLNSGCLRVYTLTVRGSKLIEAGNVVGSMPGVPLNTVKKRAQADPVGDSEPPRQPAKARSEPPRQPAKARSQSSSEKLTKGGSRVRPATRGPTGLQHDRTPDGGTDAGYRIAKIQRALKRIGLYPGPVDNVAGVRTRSAIVAYQRDYGLKRDGKASLELLRHLKSTTGTPRSNAGRK
jgi:hypothetical protein